MKNILVILVILLAVRYVSAQQKMSATFASLDNKIQISYEFQGEADKEYEIKVTLKRSSSSTYNYIPAALTGNVGKGKYANKKNLVVWNLTSKEIETLTDTDYFFEITAIEVKGGIPWYYYVGTAVVGGGAAAVLLMKKKTEETPAATTAMPPARP